MPCPCLSSRSLDIVFLVACNPHMRQAKAVVAKHDELWTRTAPGWVEAHLARMLVFDFQSFVIE